MFSYNIKDNMNYTYFQLSGAPSIATADVAEGEPVNVRYNFIAEFDESIDKEARTPSDLSKTSSKLTLWYYGYSNADADAYAAGEAVEAMHKLEANVY